MDKLRQVYFFKDFSDQEFATLKSVVRIHVVHENEVVLRQGGAADELYIVRSGSVRVVVSAPEGMEIEDEREQTLVILGPGECFGEFAFVDRLPASATVVAAEDSTLYALNHVELDRTVLARSETAAKFYTALVHVLVSRFRNTDLELAMRRVTG